MFWLIFILLATSSIDAKDEESSSNEITPSHPPVNLDANLRRALLKALTELENEANENSHTKTVETNEKIVEKASASALSFYATSASPSISTTEEATLKPIVIIQKSNGLQHKPIIEDEQIQTSASSSFTSSNKPSFSKSEGRSNVNFVLNDIKRTTTTTLPPPSTEENEAKVEDVQFFSAPLVAAFTVHQDERGLPKSVEPIYKPVLTTSKPKYTTTQTNSNLQQEQHLRTQLALQQKQKVLEEEILRLKQQQQQQNYLIRQQQLFHEQQLQLQKQKLLEEQTRLRSNQQPFIPIINNPTTQRSEITTGRLRGSVISFQPSITFTTTQPPLQSQQLPINGQQLPIKNAIDFRTPFATNFHFLSQELTAPRPQHHRVFRQEANTANFFNNNGFDYFNYYSQQQQQQSPRFFRSNADSNQFNFNRIQPPVVNQHLNNLLYNSGIYRGKQQEDLNIVSKILSLNHYGGDYRFGASTVEESRLPSPHVKKV